MGWQLRLADRYRLVERLGDRGGVEVWHAMDETLSRPVRIEVVTAEVVPGKADRERLAANIRRAARVRHPAIATIYDCDVTRDDQGSLTLYAVTELVDGVPLDLAVLPVDRALDLLCQVAGALATAHRASVVHGRLSPADVLVTQHGVKLSGFGVCDLPRLAAGGGVTEIGRGSDGGSGLARLHAGAADDVAALGAMITDDFLDHVVRDDLRSRLLLLRRWTQATDPGARPSAAHVLQALTALTPPPAPRRAPPDPVRMSTAAAPPRPDEVTRILGPGGEPPPFAPPATRARSAGRILLVGGCVLAAAATAAFVLVGTANRPGGGAPAAAGGATTSGPATAGSTPQQSDPEPGSSQAGATSPAATLAVLSRLRDAVDRNDLAGKIRTDVALDLRNVITNLENDLTGGQPVDLKQRLSDLQQKIGTREREGGLNSQTAARLTGILSRTRS